MRLATITTARGLRPALLAGEAAVDLRDAAGAAGVAVAAAEGDAGWADPGGILTLLRDPQAMTQLHRVAEALPELIASGRVAGAAGRLGPPVPRPGKIICAGLNYADHARETGQPIPASPILFAKFATSVTGPDGEVVRPAGVDDLDYEAELAVVIGRRARHVGVAAALEHVAGYCCANDVSARGAQLGDGQWLRGKSFDTFCPLGPALVTADEVGDPQHLGISCHVDGEMRQQSTTAQMIFGVAELVAFCSRAFTLEPGDVILTGTPPGVAMGRTPSPWLQPGQTCEVSIEGLGSIANRVVDESVVTGSNTRAGDAVIAAP